MNYLSQLNTISRSYANFRCILSGMYCLATSLMEYASGSEELLLAPERDFINGSFTEDSGLHPDYVTGFSDGESCFSISIVEKMNRKPQVILSFRITQKDHSTGILKDLQKFFGCGGLTVSKRIFI